MAPVGIIIVNFNGLKDTKKCIRALLQTRYKNYHIYVLDNGSKENETVLLRKLFPQKTITFYRSDINRGFSGGNNYVIQKTNERYVALINNDVEVSPEWLTPLIHQLEKHPKIAAVQPKIHWLHDKRYFDYAGAAGGFIDVFGYPFTRGRIFNTIEKDKKQYNTPANIFWASGAAMVIKRSVLNHVGLFDTLFFTYMEEIDLCYRIHRQGYTIVCEPKATVYHKVAATTNRNPLKKRYWEHRNSLFLLIKNTPLLSLVWILPIRLCLEWVSIFYYLSKRQFIFAFAVLYAQVSFVCFLPILSFHRIRQSTPQKPLPQNLLYRRSIVFDYFLLKKTHFSSLLWQR